MSKKIPQRNIAQLSITPQALNLRPNTQQKRLRYAFRRLILNLLPSVLSLHKRNKNRDLYLFFEALFSY